MFFGHPIAAYSLYTIGYLENHKCYFRFGTGYIVPVHKDKISLCGTYFKLDN